MRPKTLLQVTKGFLAFVWNKRVRMSEMIESPKDRKELKWWRSAEYLYSSARTVPPPES